MFFHHMALARPLLDFLKVRDWEVKENNRFNYVISVTATKDKT